MLNFDLREVPLLSEKCRDTCLCKLCRAEGDYVSLIVYSSLRRASSGNNIILH